MQPKNDNTAALKPTAEREQYLTFNLSGELFAIGILSIREIIEYAQLTQALMMPRYIRGVINLRGSVVPVVDLLARFGQGLTEPKRRTCVVIVEVDTEDGIQQLGVLVRGHFMAVVAIAAQRARFGQIGWVYEVQRIGGVVLLHHFYGRAVLYQDALKPCAYRAQAGRICGPVVHGSAISSRGVNAKAAAPFCGAC